MTGVLTLYRSSIGKKVIMAVTGIVLVSFLVIHMYGNTKMFYGAEAFNAYAAGLRELGHPVLGHEHLLWVMRVVLLGSVVGHIWSAMALTGQSQKSAYANGVGSMKRYAQKQRRTGYAAYTMRYGGIVIFLFIVYHLLHFTFGMVGYGPGREYIAEKHGEFNAYSNVVLGFQVWPVSFFYILAMGFLGFHLFHGIWSAFQTLGLNNEKYTGMWRGVAIVVTAIIILPNMFFPIAVMTGIVGL
ncbi:succinate dehydrogenase cytochrome b subunit [Candidatus Oscillochloris fontis]|uniref:succinate dehydrogenase cytochrome b subunit n=1 Tax=Candidatus Oscillochloris fontis TaxID=2496868 RepID=UPI00101D68D3|nr:succinate dehydrogenase cytochrome b subunit [Candidatus Oscillochloris fontis]